MRRSILLTIAATVLCTIVSIAIGMEVVGLIVRWSTADSGVAKLAAIMGPFLAMSGLIVAGARNRKRA